jgi:clan AA aspartic protease
MIIGSVNTNREAVI